MLISIGIFAKEICKSIKNKKFVFVIIYVLAGILCLLVPAALESWYLITTNILFVIIATIVFAAYPITYAILKVLGKIEE